MLTLPGAEILQGILGGPATYRVDGSDVSLSLDWCFVEESTRLGRAGSGFDAEFAPGLGRYAQARVDRAELAAAGIAAPGQGDVLTCEGVAWRVEQARPEGALWLLHASTDQRWGR